MFGAFSSPLYIYICMYNKKNNKDMTNFSAAQARFSHARFSMDLADLLLWLKSYRRGGQRRWADFHYINMLNIYKYKSVK